MGARRCCLGGGALAVALVLRAGLAFGERPPAVDIFVAGKPNSMARLQSGLGIGERPIRWVPIAQVDPSDVMRRPSEVETPAARAWVDCSLNDRVRIYFASANGERFLVRDVALPDGWTELVLETLAQVIESSLSALDLSAASGMSRAEMTAVLNTRARAPTPHGPKWHFSGSAFYAVQAFAPQYPVEQGPGLGARFGQSEVPVRVAGWISAQYLLPETLQTDLIGVRLDTVALRVGAEVARDLSDRVAVAFDVGVGGDVVEISPRQGGIQHAALSPDRLFWTYAARFEVAVVLQAVGGIELRLAALADLDSNMHYDVAVDGSPVRVVTPWWLRPGLAAGVMWR